MNTCVNCKNEDLIISTRESRVMPNTKYAACCQCGKVMLLINNMLLPTPTDDTPQTKLLIQDAADCFDDLSSLGMAASLDGLTTPINIQPTQSIDSLRKDLSSMLSHIDEEDEKYEEYEDEDYYDEDEYEYYDEGEDCRDYEDIERNLLVSTYNSPENKDYLLVLPSGEKQLYKNTSKDFMVNIINDIGSHIMLYELKAVELKTQIKYSF